MTTPHAVLQVGPLMPAVEDAIVHDYDAVRLPDDASDRENFLAERAAEFTVAVTSGRFGVGTDLMQALPNLQAVVNFGVGYDTTDAALAAERGIGVSNTPNVLNDCVADTAIALYVDVLRRISAADRYVRRGDWAAKGNFPLATKASGKRVGILGLGRIGKVIARRLEGFDCTIAYHNRRPVEGVEYEYVDSLVELARRSDVLIVAAAGGPESKNLVNADVLEALAPPATL
ncbi:D-isomer specific 2-hydroxyacid dehydrogenase [Arthrobacter crystallopoietes BAB-32]|uniref:D-isomer specific 2-hydroxyacid dehydrogenase n=1 Tax=Arthrobacter crystallopoietes BAB-32 TaxID=1246476 RepID=N1V0N8_9MICC|nr:D-isomer specific 2-hydroxyacid dehydrogenase [Arthrobacter crystallopoietes BAB-32]